MERTGCNAYMDKQEMVRNEEMGAMKLRCKIAETKTYYQQ